VGNHFLNGIPGLSFFGVMVFTMKNRIFGLDVIADNFPGTRWPPESISISLSSVRPEYKAVSP
jgi:hypothetical protein